MSFVKRGLIFFTFFGAVFAIALLVASVVTEQWVVAKAKRNTKESEGKIQFGLFHGKKELNVGYGWRTDEIDVIHQLKHEPEILNYSLWFGTVACVCGALLFCMLSAVFAVVNTARKTSVFLVSIRGLYLWNTLALLANLGIIGFWLAQFFLRIQHNVMTREDVYNKWTSENMADLGYSFWFVTGSAITNFINIIVICFANTDNDETDSIYPVLEEKTNGAIMLY
ncbi:uncharacterized protein LOC112905695 [Agrilus planipennis]|uniref:Uncharacterized protein LOC112905694 n=1 Tax=Agrilus planipennis TaxID=224129 RepID=A0A7F5REI4_AGRPL|nr:uncharacterized protein LOC112905694 [Agrilus planipennis]XP_025834386.1 uncharacterized protein LOC112905694 [Agrilus planipennis]XP_025834387.1 uncharacterized protein LOC112905694 [Agrilus planipennis]XP_025834388.1 uncharacterized protein LOC112905695 [Agrilus planipennis]XP_025834389.1 uncharacterized protein LOC112905695 [Agrilus planipennis]XP_025834390.1 uncharacterized protein LOC112905695 [Agrilus planipennis]